jgi:DNA-binding response OmpR family regulator
MIEDACGPPSSNVYHSLSEVAEGLESTGEQLDDVLASARTADAVVVEWDLLQAPLVGALSYRLQGGATPLVALCEPDEVDAVAALSVGADIVASLPLSVRLLKAQVAAHRRHSVTLLRKARASVEGGEPGGMEPVVYTANGSGAGHLLERRVVRAGPLRLDHAALGVEVWGAPVDVTPLQFQLLAFLVEHAGHVLTRDQFLSAVWGFDFEPGTNIVDVHIHFLRRVLKEQGLDGAIKTVRGIGYRFDVPPGQVREDYAGWEVIKPTGTELTPP